MSSYLSLTSFTFISDLSAVQIIKLSSETWINSCFIGKFSCIIFRVFLVFLHKMSVVICFVMTCFMTLIILNKSCCLLDSSWGRKGQALVFIILDSYTWSILCVFQLERRAGLTPSKAWKFCVTRAESKHLWQSGVSSWSSTNVIA